MYLYRPKSKHHSINSSKKSIIHPMLDDSTTISHIHQQIQPEALNPLLLFFITTATSLLLLQPLLGLIQPFESSWTKESLEA